MAAPLVPFDPTDKVQAGFLGGLQASEGTLNSGEGAYTETFGGGSSAGLATDQYGFPDFSASFGGSSTSASGAYQFQRGTWDQVASANGLNFANPNDQDAGAWILAQQNYSAATGGGSLYSALQNGQTSQVASALSPTWTSLVNPSAFTSAFNSVVGGASGASGSSDASGSSGGSSGGIMSWLGNATGISSLVADVENWVERGFLVIAAVVIIGLALWSILGRTGAIPGPGETAKAAALAL